MDTSAERSEDVGDPEEGDEAVGGGKREPMESESSDDETVEKMYVNPFVGSLNKDQEYVASRFKQIGVKDHIVLVHVLIDAAPGTSSGGVDEWSINECLDRLEFQEAGRNCGDLVLEDAREDIIFYLHHFYKYVSVDVQVMQKLFKRREDFYTLYDKGMIPERVIKLKNIMPGRDDIANETVRYFPYYLMQKMLLRLGYAESRLVTHFVLWAKWMMDNGNDEHEIVTQFRTHLRGLHIRPQMWESYHSVQLVRRIVESVMDTMEVGGRDRYVEALIERRFVAAAENPKDFYDTTIVI